MEEQNIKWYVCILSTKSGERGGIVNKVRPSSINKRCKDILTTTVVKNSGATSTQQQKILLYKSLLNTC